jgi:flagellar basal body-associated protein FliL
VALGRKAYLVIFLVVLVALAAAAGAYYRYRVLKAVAECDSPAPPEKPATPPPNLPGFQTGGACGPGETAGKKK